MKLNLSKKLFSTLTAAALFLGASAVNANTISLVNANDNTSSDINIATDLGIADSFAIEIRVDTTENAGFGAMDLSWAPGVLSLNSVIAGPTFSLFGVPTIDNIAGNVTGIFGAAAPFSNNTVDYLFATLNFVYTGDGSTGTSIDVTGLTAALGGWSEVGTGLDITFGTVTGATVSAVPVPPAFLLFASAIAGLSISGRRKA